MLQIFKINMDGVKVSLPLLILMLKLSKVFQMQETHVEFPSSFYLHQGFVGILELFRHVKKEVCSMLHIGIPNGCGQEKRQRQQPAAPSGALGSLFVLPSESGENLWLKWIGLCDSVCVCA